MPLPARCRAVAELAKEKAADREQLDGVLANTAAPMITAHAPAVCRKVFADDAVVVFDGGNTAVWGDFFTELRAPNTQLSTAHFDHLGAGIGQALGAAVARPEAQVYCLIGDGAMGFNVQEIETAVRHRLKVVFIVCRCWRVGASIIRSCCSSSSGRERFSVSTPTTRSPICSSSATCWESKGRTVPSSSSGIKTSSAPLRAVSIKEVPASSMLPATAR